MKKIIYKIGFILLATTFILSCTSPDPVTNYSPAEYEFPSSINLGTSSVTNSSFQFAYDVNGGGQGYYVVVEGGSEVPSNQDVFNGTADGQLQSGNFPLTGESVIINVDDDELLCDGMQYTIYAVQFTSDSFLSETPTATDVTTVANADISGTYNTVTNGVSGFFGVDVVNLESQMTITDNGDGTFTFSDITGGIYADPNFFGGFGHPDLPGNFEIPCNDIIGDIPSLFFGCCGDVIVYNGFINLDGTISAHWENAFGEVMDVVYTKQ